MPPQHEPARRRRALLIATGTYADPGLAKLRAPAGDVEALAEVLADGAIGEFDVRKLIDEPTEEVKRAIDAFFHEARLDDLLLLYVSGHGVLSQSRHFYFATTNTNLKWLRSTGVEDRFVNDVMQESRARSIVLLLDCCHSGAFARGLAPKSGLSVDVEHRFEGRGRVTLTASTELEYAFEETEAKSDISRLGRSSAGSLFTSVVVEGLATGEADVDEDGIISVDELYDYVCRRVRERSPNQTPGMAGDVRGDIVIAKSPRGPSLPPDLVQAIESPLAGVREGAVGELEKCLRSPTRGLAHAAEAALKRLAEDDSRRVSTAARDVLAGSEAPQEGRHAEVPPPAKPDAPASGEPGKPEEPDEPKLQEREGWRTRPRRGVLLAGALGALAAAVAAIALLTAGGSQTSPPPSAATPYDFGGNGHQDVVLGLPTRAQAGASVQAGVVLIHAGPGGGPPAVITERAAGLPGRPSAHDRFGSGLTSADFNGDGSADLAVTAPGKSLLAVMYGSRGSGERFSASRRRIFRADELSLPAGARLTGGVLVGRDFNGDRFADLAIGAPPRGSEAPGSGGIRIVFGSADGLRASGAETLTPPDAELVGFARTLAAGDVDGDGSADLVEGAPDGKVAGHLSYCPGSPRGPTRCMELQGGKGTGTSSLAVADVNGDGTADIVQGDGQDVGGQAAAGEVRLWLGRSDGPPSVPIVITQKTPGMPPGGDSNAGDEFGAAVEAGDVDGDGPADMMVGAPGEDDATGRITLIKGASDGFATSGNSILGEGGEPNRRFGSALSLLDVTDAERPDLVVGAAGAGSLADAVVVLATRDDGPIEELRLQGLGGVVDGDPDDIVVGRDSTQ